jgi:hypothetical protein
MDTAVYRAITSVRLDDDLTQQRWFEVLCQTYDQLTQSDQLDWDHFRPALVDGASSAGVSTQIVEQFVDFVASEDPAPIETIRQMRDQSTDLPALYRQLASEAATGDGTTAGDGAAASGGYDEPAWNAFLAENGARWNGEEASWEQFRTWFLYEADQRGLAEPAGGFIAYVESQSDKAAVFAQYGVQLTTATAQADNQQATADVSSFPELKHGDSGEWVEYLDTMLTSNGF